MNTTPKLSSKARAEMIQAVKAGHTAALLAQLKSRHGIAFDECLAGLPPEQRRMRMDGYLGLMAQDAVQSELVTVSSAGIPYFLANWLDPQIIPILVSPMMAAEIVGEVMKGDWLTETAMFLTAEAVGETSAYGDYSMSGQSNVNVNFPQRQNFLFQAFLQYGQREVARMGLAKLDWVSQQQQANALILMKALNYQYFYGVANLENYGLLNDPSLQPAITATYAWLTNASATANTIYQDVVRMFINLQAQSGGVVRADAKMVLAMSPTQAMALKFVTQYNTNSVLALLKQNFPNIRLTEAIEYGPPYNASGQLVQLIVEELEGHRTAECAFSSKLMAHNMIVAESSWRQKRSSGGFGCVIFRPFLISQMYA